MKSPFKRLYLWIILGFALIGGSVIAFKGGGNPSEPLAPGTPAPAFSLPGTLGKQVTLQDYRGQNIILVFYPMDQTPGCTLQLCSLRDDRETLQKLNTIVLASNPADLASHQAFAKKQNYPFALLVDANQQMAKAYHALGSMGMIQRTVYIIDGEGMIRYGKRGMPPNSELFALIRSLKPQAQKGE